MALRRLRISGSTHGERHRVIELAKESISRSGGWIVDFKLFSNTSICLNFELPAGNLDQLSSSLQLIDLQLSRESEDLLANSRLWQEGMKAQPPVADIAGTLQITFIHNEPDLRIAVPSIPG